MFSGRAPGLRGTGVGTVIAVKRVTGAGSAGGQSQLSSNGSTGTLPSDAKISVGEINAAQEACRRPLRS